MAKEEVKIKLPKSVYAIMIITIAANAIATYLIINYVAQ
jgi:hypothetical protein